MSLIDYILLGIIVALAVLAILYIRRSGKGCSGCASCPYSASCKKVRKKAVKRRLSK
jgi:hypothetical protein